MILLILFHALYGLSLPLSKILLVHSSPLFLTGLRMTGGGLMICIPLLLWSRSFSVFKRDHLLAYCKIALFIVYFKYVFRYMSLTYLSVAKMAFIMACSPFVAAFFSYLWYQERLRRMQWFSLVLGFAGLLPLLIMRGQGEQNLTEFMFISWPELLAFASIVAHVIGVHCVRTTLHKDGAPSPLALNGITAFIGGSFALATAPLFESLPTCHDIVVVSGGVIFLIFLSNIVCHTIYMHLVKRYSVTFITLTDFLATFFSTFYGWLFLHEQFSWHYIASGVVIVTALYLFYRHEKGR